MTITDARVRIAAANTLLREMPMLMDRDLAAKLGHETLAILRKGSYPSPSGEVVGIADQVRVAVEGTVSYPPGCGLPTPENEELPTQIEVVNETTLVAAKKLVGAGHPPVALNFASATHPGGGFLSGARAQEESLARSSGLHPCLVGNDMYPFHQARRDAMYTDYAIYSPDVPIIRTDEGTLLDKPYSCSFITCAAPNAKALMKYAPSRIDEIPHVMRQRISRVLAIAATHGHKTVILGAWGCGAFGNDSTTIAPLFREALEGPFRGVFERVVFAVTDGSDEQRFIGPFRQVFGAK